jgi:hypothetical protein
MSLLKSCPVAEAQIDPEWRVLCTIGGVATMILIVYSLVTMIGLVVLGGAPGSAEEAFSLLQSNKIAGLVRLDVLTSIVFMPLYYLLFLGLYIALRRAHGAYAALATVLAFVGITLVLATPSAFSMMFLSDKYAVATDAQKGQLLAAGEAILASDMWHGTGAIVGGMLLQSGALLISVLMLRGHVFSKLTAYVGILTHGLDLAHFLAGIFTPLAIIFMAIAGTLYLLWFSLVGWRLWQLGRREKQPAP